MSAPLDPHAVKRRARQLGREFDLGVLAVEFGVRRADVDLALWRASGGVALGEVAPLARAGPPAGGGSGLRGFLAQMFGGRS